MGKFPKRTPISLQERLRRYVGQSVGINAQGLALEPGKLTKVFKSTFIVVQGERFVPKSLNELQVFNIPRASKTSRVGVRTTFDASGRFDDVELILIGRDFIELQLRGNNNERFLIPINKVEGLFSI